MIGRIHHIQSRCDQCFQIQPQQIQGRQMTRHPSTQEATLPFPSRVIQQGAHFCNERCHDLATLLHRGFVLAEVAVGAQEVQLQAVDVVVLT